MSTESTEFTTEELEAAAPALEEIETVGDIEADVEAEEEAAEEVEFIGGLLGSLIPAIPSIVQGIGGLFGGGGGGGGALSALAGKKMRGRIYKIAKKALDNLISTKRDKLANVIRKSGRKGFCILLCRTVCIKLPLPLKPVCFPICRRVCIVLYPYAVKRLGSLKALKAEEVESLEMECEECGM